MTKKSILITLILLTVLLGVSSTSRNVRIRTEQSTIIPNPTSSPPSFHTMAAGSYSPLIYTEPSLSWGFSSQPSGSSLETYQDVGVYGTNYLPDRHNDTAWTYSLVGLTPSWNDSSVNPEDAYGARFVGGLGSTNFTTPVTNLPTTTYFAVAIAVVDDVNYVDFALKNGTDQITVQLNYVTGIFTTRCNGQPITPLMNTTKPLGALVWFYYVFNMSSLWAAQPSYGSFQGGNYTAEFYVHGIGNTDTILDHWYLGDNIQYGQASVTFTGELTAALTAPAGRSTLFNLTYGVPQSNFSYPTNVWINATLNPSDPFNLTVRTAVINETTTLRADTFTITGTSSTDLLAYFQTLALGRIDRVQIRGIDVWSTVTGGAQTIRLDTLSITARWEYREATLGNLTGGTIDYLSFPFEISQVDQIYNITYSDPAHRTWFITFNTSTPLDAVTISDAPATASVSHENATVIRFNLTVYPTASAGEFAVEFKDYKVNTWDELETRIMGGGSGFYTESDLKIIGVNITTVLNDPPILYGLANFTTPIQIFIGVYETYGVYRDVNATIAADVNFTILPGSIIINACNITAPHEIFYIRGYSVAPTIQFITPENWDVITTGSFDIDIRVTDQNAITDLSVWLLGSNQYTEGRTPIEGDFDSVGGYWNGSASVDAFSEGEKRIIVEATDARGYTVRIQIRISVDLGTLMSAVTVGGSAAVVGFCFILSYKATTNRKRSIQRSRVN